MRLVVLLTPDQAEALFPQWARKIGSYLRAGGPDHRWPWYIDLPPDQ
jgi:hypothetical protein